MDDRYRAVDAWVRRLLPATPPAILLGIGSPNDLSMLRSFRRRGIPALHLVSGRLVLPVRFPRAHAARGTGARGSGCACSIASRRLSSRRPFC